MYNALLIARYIIKYCNENGYVISNLKLQKLLYFIQAEFLVSKNTSCFSDNIEAWDFGPVVPIVYRRYKVYGSAHIPFMFEDDSYNIEKEDKDLINGILDKCAVYSASYLVDITHKQDPWINAYHSRNKLISNESIKQFFIENS